MLLGALSLAFGYFQWRRTEVIAAAGTAEARLEQAVRQREARAWQQLLGRDSELIDLGFTVRRDGKVKLPSRDEAPRSVEGLVAFYRQLEPRRMVVMGRSGAAAGGDAGTGKTVAVIKLLQDWVAEGQPGQAVLVRLSAGDWPGGGIEDWLVAHLDRVLGLRHSEAREMVRAHLVIPVIDGLDEMDGTDAPGHGSQAAALLDVLNNRQLDARLLPVVVTCRADHYAALTAADRQLRNAAVVRLKRVDPARARKYLDVRAGQRDAQGRWERVLDAVHSDGAGSTAVQAALDSPWRLTLATVVFQERGSGGVGYERHPDTIIDMAEAGTLRAYLLDNFIAAAVSAACNAKDAKVADINREAKQAAQRRRRLRQQGDNK
ncbi:NACHT domain-containing protein, partial [Streptomyces sp. NPDC019890]|uniref:NACHT domain-containing protein n=1 Tax=Streptomyces sp. NPDC019890 TaxID=3365064 RepID=UPI00384D6845